MNLKNKLILTGVAALASGILATSKHRQSTALEPGSERKNGVCAVFTNSSAAALSPFKSHKAPPVTATPDFLAKAPVSGELSSPELPLAGAIMKSARAKQERITRGGQYGKVDEALARLAQRVKSSTGAHGFTNLSGPLMPAWAKVSPEGRIQVYVHTTNAPEAQRSLLQSLGLEIEIVQPEMNVVQGWLDAAALDLVAVLPGVAKVTLPEYAVRAQGGTLTQGDALLRANLVRQMTNPGPYMGAGVKLAIISDGATSLHEAVASGDLPTNIVVHPTLRDPGDESTASAEIVHDLAPDAQLYIAGPATSAEMIAAINWAVTQGCHVIFDDICFFDQPFFADGPIANTVRTTVTNNGRVYLTAAGNYGTTHYQGLFSDSGILFENKPLHDFKLGAGVDVELNFGVQPGQRIILHLQWADPFGASANDYDLFLVDANTGTIVASSEAIQDGNDNPRESLSWVNPSASMANVSVVIEKFSGGARTLELFVVNALNGDDDSSGVDSVFGHAALPEVISCGAINSDNPGLTNIASYSSRGPSTLVFPSVEVRQTPFIAAVDFVSVSGAGEFDPVFGGTSAAVPHVAAICALMLQKNPAVAPAQIRAALAASAVDKGAGGFDNTFGHGLVDAPGAVNALPGPARLEFSRAGSRLVLRWNDPGFVLQSAGVATGAYVTISGATSPYTNMAPFPRRFFRLVRP